MNEEYPPPEQQQEGVPFMYPTPPMDEFGTENSLRFQLDPDELIKKMRYIFLGYEQIVNKETQEKEWIRSKTKKALINEEGMDVLEPILRGYLDKLFPLSDLEREQIENITLGLEFDLRNLITLNFLNDNPWQLKDLVTASAIKNIICNQVYATLRKAYLRGYQNFLKTIQRYVETRNLQQRSQAPVQQQKSGMGKIPIIGRIFG